MCLASVRAWDLFLAPCGSKYHIGWPLPKIYLNKGARETTQRIGIYMLNVQGPRTTILGTLWTLSTSKCGADSFLALPEWPCYPATEKILTCTMTWRNPEKISLSCTQKPKYSIYSFLASVWSGEVHGVSGWNTRGRREGRWEFGSRAVSLQKMKRSGYEWRWWIHIQVQGLNDSGLCTMVILYCMYFTMKN